MIKHHLFKKKKKKESQQDVNSLVPLFKCLNCPL